MKSNLKISMQPKYLVSLAGGLGNQLFQLAAALSIFGKSNFGIEWSLGSPRLNNNSQPELSNFNLPNNVAFENIRKVNYLEKKLGNLTLRSIANGKQAKMRISAWNAVNLFSISLLKSFFWQGYRFVAHPGVGYEDINFEPIENTILIGYFQSYKWVCDGTTLNKISSILLKEESEDLRLLKLVANYEKPLILHLRLGDYLNEVNFGIPSLEYYENATRKLWDTGKYEKIWIFSDEPKIAKQKLPNWILELARWVNIDNNQAASNLQAMRYGFGYVISNSTFSWWGAILSFDQNAEVIAPTPWFKAIPEPKDLIPENWKRVPAVM